MSESPDAELDAGDRAAEGRLARRAFHIMTEAENREHGHEVVARWVRTAGPLSPEALDLHLVRGLVRAYRRVYLSNHMHNPAMLATFEGIREAALAAIDDQPAYLAKLYGWK